MLHPFFFLLKNYSIAATVISMRNTLFSQVAAACGARAHAIASTILLPATRQVATTAAMIERAGRFFDATHAYENVSSKLT